MLDLVINRPQTSHKIYCGKSIADHHILCASAGQVSQLNLFNLARQVSGAVSFAVIMAGLFWLPLLVGG